MNQQPERDRNKSDEQIKEIIRYIDENEIHGLKFGMIPERLEDQNLTNKDVAQIMNLNPEGHF